MIPLRPTESVKRFPYSSLLIVSVWVVADLVSRLWPGPRIEFLDQVAYVPLSANWVQGLASVLFHSHVFSLLVTLLYTWVFTPKIFERRGRLFTYGVGFSGTAFALMTFTWIHSLSASPLLCPEAFLGALLGVYMRRDIWGTVDTWVIGLGWARIYEVPSYVLLFFWFFYLLVGNFFLSSPFADGPMLYWLPFVSFLWGFLVESTLGNWLDHRNPSTQNHD